MAATRWPALSTTSRKLRPDIEIVDQQWPKLGEADFTPFITAQMGKKPDAVFCDVFGGDFVTFAKQATPLGYFKAINNRLLDAGEVGTTDLAQALGNDYPYGIWSDAYDPVIWGGDNEPPAHKEFVEAPEGVHQSRNTLRAGRSWATSRSMRLAEGIKKAGKVDNKVAKALLGLTFDTPIGKRTINEKIPRDRRGRSSGAT